MSQINLNNPVFIKVLKYFVFAIVFYLVVQWFKSCSSDVKESKIKTIVIPEKKGNFESKKPESRPIVINRIPISEIKRDGLVYVENTLNKKLIEENEKLRVDFLKMSDSLKMKTYEKSIELNKFTTSFEDEYLKLNIDGIARGSVEEITPSYIIKRQNVESKCKETKLRVLAGGSLGINKELNQLVFKGGIDFQNENGDLFSAEYLQVNNNGFVMAGFKKSILNIKR